MAFNTGYKRFSGGGGSSSSALNSFFDALLDIIEVNGSSPVWSNSVGCYCKLGLHNTQHVPGNIFTG